MLDDIHLPDPFEQLNTVMIWPSVNVKLHKASKPITYFIQSLGPFLSCQVDPMAEPAAIIFLPNFSLSASDENCVTITSVLMSSFNYIFSFKTNKERDTFFNWCIQSQISFQIHVQSLDVGKCCLADILTGIIPGVHSPVQILCSVYRKGETFVFNAKPKNDKRYQYEIILGKNAYINCAHSLPKGLPPPASNYFLIRGLDSKEAGFFCCANLQAAMIWVLSLFSISQQISNRPLTSSVSQPLITIEEIEDPVAPISDSIESIPSSDIVSNDMSHHEEEETQKEEPEEVFETIEELRKGAQLMLNKEKYILPSIPDKEPEHTLNEKAIQTQIQLAISKLTSDRHDTTFPDVTQQRTDELVNRTIARIEEEENNLGIPSYIAEELNSAKEPINLYADKLAATTEKIMCSDSKIITEATELCKLISAFFHNGLLTSLYSALQQFIGKIEGLNCALDLLNSNLRAMWLDNSSIIGAILLNNKLLIPVMRAISEDPKWITTTYSATSLIADQKTFSFVMMTLSMLVKGFTFRLPVRLATLSKKYIAPYFPHVGFLPSRDNIAYIFQFGMKRPAIPIAYIRAVGEDNQIISSSIKSIHSLTLNGWIDKGLEERKLHIWFGFLYSAKEKTLKFYHADGTMADPYRARMLIKVVHRYVMALNEAD